MTPWDVLAWILVFIGATLSVFVVAACVIAIQKSRQEVTDLRELLLRVAALENRESSFKQMKG